jgi:nucleoid-associated protein YgaU
VATTKTAPKPKAEKPTNTKTAATGDESLNQGGDDATGASGAPGKEGTQDNAAELEARARAEAEQAAAAAADQARVKAEQRAAEDAARAAAEAEADAAAKAAARKFPRDMLLVNETGQSWVVRKHVKPSSSVPIHVRDADDLHRLRVDCKSLLSISDHYKPVETKEGEQPMPDKLRVVEIEDQAE